VHGVLIDQFSVAGISLLINITQSWNRKWQLAAVHRNKLLRCGRFKTWRV